MSLGSPSGKREEVVSVARAMLRGECDLLEGTRKICSLRFHLENPDAEIFFPLVAVDDDTDHFPLGTLREKYSPDALKRIDIEMTQYVESARTEILDACKAIISTLSN